MICMYICIFLLSVLYQIKAGHNLSKERIYFLKNLEKVFDIYLQKD